jgi:membrane-associated phospholipid phosphatase
MWDPCLVCEARLPYAPAWIWVYLAYYPLCFAPLLLPEIRREPGLFWRFAGKAGGRVLWTATALIAASTLLVKQHCLLDLVAGAAVGTAANFASSPSAWSSAKPA